MRRWLPESYYHILVEMKLNLFYIILCCLLVYCNNDKSVEKHQQDTTAPKALLDSFEHHFKILDSVVLQNPLDTLYRCCSESTFFLELKTEIEASSPGTFFGRTYFTKRDWEKWHDWYRNKYNSGN